MEENQVSEIMSVSLFLADIQIFETFVRDELTDYVEKSDFWFYLEYSVKAFCPTVYVLIVLADIISSILWRVLLSIIKGFLEDLVQ